LQPAGCLCGHHIESGGNSIALKWQWPHQQLSTSGDSNSFCNVEAAPQNSTVKGMMKSKEVAAIMSLFTKTVVSIATLFLAANCLLHFSLLHCAMDKPL